jgi:4-hydroxy-3-polyprenylbenzoate decarboxylase
MSSSDNKRIVIAVTGASGSLYAKCLLDRLAEHRDQCEKIGLVLSDQVSQVWETEIGEPMPDYPFEQYHVKDFYAPFASGSAGYDAMIVIPCSMGTLGRIANGISDSLITRAADVMLKERRKLVLVARETPLNLIHLRNMSQLTEAGAVIMPAVPSFYSGVENKDDIARTVSDRALHMIGLKFESFRWGEK